MAIDFPASPSTNDIHQVGSQIWFWNATYWELKSNVTKFSSQDAAPSSPIAGDIWYETDTGKLFIRYDSYWVEIGHGSDGQSFIVSETKPASTTTGDIWYESDTGKTFIYYDSYWVEIGHASDADVSAYAPLASPTLTGTPAAPTAAANTSTTQIATTAFVMTEVGDYAPLADPTFTGTPDAPTAAADTNTTQIATTAYVQTELGAISSDSLSDADSDTKIQVEEASDEDKIRFDTGGTERVVLDSSGLEIKSGGLKLDGLSNAGANVLDDYEEGEFTISATCQSGTITINTGNNTCAYTKVGRLVTVQGEVNVSAISSPSGQITIAGFPFVATNSATETAARCWNMGTVINTSSDVAGTPVFAIFANSSTISCFTSGTVSQDYFGGRIDTGTFFQVHGSYITDS